MNKPNWQKLIETHVEGNGIALTIPFVIGALRGPDNNSPMTPQQASFSIARLVESLSDDHADTESVWIYRCGDLGGQPAVKMIYSKDDIPVGANILESDDGKMPKLLVSDIFTDNGPFEIEKLVDTLAIELSGALCEARFSYTRNKGYQQFTAQDILDISATL